MVRRLNKVFKTVILRECSNLYHLNASSVFDFDSQSSKSNPFCMSSCFYIFSSLFDTQPNGFKAVNYALYDFFKLDIVPD